MQRWESDNSLMDLVRLFLELFWTLYLIIENISLRALQRIIQTMAHMMTTLVTFPLSYSQQASVSTLIHSKTWLLILLVVA